MHLGVQNMVVCGGEICCDVSSTMILGGGCVSLFLCDRWKKDKMATVSPGYIQIRFVSGDSIFCGRTQLLGVGNRIGSNMTRTASCC